MAAFTETFRVMVVDYHPIVRQGLTGLIATDDRFSVCSEAGDAQTAWELVQEQKPDLVVLDLGLPDQSGLELLKRIKVLEGIATKVLVCSLYDDSLMAERCLRAGAMGYVNKAAAADQILEAIIQVAHGEVYLSQETTQRLIGRKIGTDAADTPLNQLTDRELEVFELIGKGLSARDIANQLRRSIKTVETHRDKIKQKLQIESTSMLVRHAVLWVLDNPSF